MVIVPFVRSIVVTAPNSSFNSLLAAATRASTVGPT
jgi:hypothetical protein